MCGIIAYLSQKESTVDDKLLELVNKGLKNITHRGPDFEGIWIDQSKKAVLGHTRLAIIDPNSGKQPFYDKNNGVALTVNGEIYNYKDIKSKILPSNTPYQTESDCEVILHLYNYIVSLNQYSRDGSSRDINHIMKQMFQLCLNLKGMFSFVIYDEKLDQWMIARDPVGIIPLYIGYKGEDLVVSSEMKSLLELQCDKIEEFPPGYIYTKSDLIEYKKYYKWFSEDSLDKITLTPSETVPTHYNTQRLFDQLSDAVKSHLMSDVPFGVLLSGGLDSSIIAALVRYHRPNDIIHTFSVGSQGSPDLIAARKVADHLKTVHHECVFTFETGFNMLPKAIWHIETYDTTTVRASTPMILLSQYIKNNFPEIKMVLSGEGSDEVFGGYLYFSKAPSPDELYKETVRKVSLLHKYDCKRANKSMAAFSIECRPPFLDINFLDYAMSIHPSLKMSGNQIEKKILREAFQHLLPHEIAWRQKEQFSDGVGYNWIDGLKNMTSSLYPNYSLELSRIEYPINTPRTPEEYHYRKVFESLFKVRDHFHSCIPWGPSVACSSFAAFTWDKFNNDPSGRTISTHQSSLSSNE